jgi:hypothetical protein
MHPMEFAMTTAASDKEPTGVDNPFPAAITPTYGVNPRDALATSMHAAPGMYAVLVGSGMSKSAGINTAWEVVEDLIRRVATSEGANPEDFDDDPTKWWADQGRPELRYDRLLEELSSTEAARRMILRKYFDPVPATGEPVPPSRAHAALASLCAAGRVRVIVTTNFDGLIERALEAVGIAPQVISTPTALRGMTPLALAPVTVIKLHGDYNTPGLKNTSLEVGKYGAAQNRLLARILDEYGLLVVGWSGEFDTALVTAMERASSRRYPTYWASYLGATTEPANRLIAQRQAHVIDTTGADELMGDLVERIDRLDSIAARRTGPRPILSYRLSPDISVVAQGWALIPLLVVRTVAVVSPATDETVGLIGPAQRRRITGALAAMPVTNQLRQLAKFGAVPSSGLPADGPLVSPTALTQWLPPEGAHQSTVLARYRLGGDGSSGATVLADVRMPSRSIGGGVTFVLDMGFSMEVKLALPTVAELFRDGLVAVTSILPEAIDDILPADAAPTQCEIHLMASTGYGAGVSRENDISGRVDIEPFKSLDSPNPNVDQQMGFAATLSQPLTTLDAAELVAYGMNYMALSIGFLDPTRGNFQIRDALGLTPEET